MTPYNRTPLPPAPWAYMTLTTSAGGTSVSDVPMLLDTGADISLVPLAAVEKLGGSISPPVPFELEGFDGTRSAAQAVQLDLILFNRVFSGLFVIVAQDRGLLGRDILNHLSILLDGPRLEWGLHPEN